MRIRSRFVLLSLIGAVAATGAQAAAPAPLSVVVEGVVDGKRVPDSNVVCLPTKDGKSDQSGQSLRPTIGWSGAPATAKSYAIFVMDPDVPADFTDAGKDGKTLPVEAKRMNFFHYGVINIPAETTSFPGGAADVQPGLGIQLANDMGANHYVATPAQFGGPCPPWNDERLHHYHFIVMALDKDAPIQDAEPLAHSKWVPDNSAKATFNRLTASDHVLARGEVVGTYSLNPKMK